MNKHTRLAAGILVLVLVILIAATISFSANVSKRSGSNQNSASDTAINANGNEIVQGDNHLYGMSDAAGNTILEPEWKQLQFVGTDYLAAKQETEDGDRFGVLDLDGNVAAPFVYQDIQALTASYYLATLADTEQVVLYDRDFCAADAMIWDSSKWEKPLLTLTKGEDSFQYSLEKDVLQLVQVEMSRKTDDFSFSVSSEKLNAALLSPEEWRLSLDQMTQFLTMVKRQDFSHLQECTDQEHENAVLNGAVLADSKVTKTDSVLYLQADSDDAGKAVLTWQMALTIRDADNNTQTRTLTVKMQKSGKEIWLITEAKLG